MKADHLEDVRLLDISSVWTFFSFKVGRVDMYKTRPDGLLDLKNVVHIADIKVTHSFKNGEWWIFLVTGLCLSGY